jgi:hypothetical protein
MRRLTLCIAALTICALVSGCTRYDIGRLAADNTAGRDNGTDGSALARLFLIGELQAISSDVRIQDIGGGTNVVAVLPGTDLADQYVVVGAHYDHLGSSCQFKSSGDQICNGATDNAAGVASVLAIGRAIAGQSTKPRRSVVLALWDSEEDGLLGSRFYADHPLLPLADTVAYVNFDIQGANLSPSLRNSSFAVAAESGGERFQSIVRSAINQSTLNTDQLSSIFGQNRSDYVSFLAKQVPSVFFTDATGPCYHTNDDEIGIVDFDKLDQQIAIALRVTRELAGTDDPPEFTSGTPLVTYADAVVLQRAAELIWRDRARFSAQDQATLSGIRDDLTQIVLDGRAAFGSDDVGTVINSAATVVINLLPKGPCDGFLTQAEARDSRTVERLAEQAR